jgi:Heme/copper-type cytochrome/quinol oxidases, subunit 1
MQNADALGTGLPVEPKVNYLTNGFTLKSWLLTKDHKRIAIMYLITVSMFFLAGGLYASAIRLELLTPDSDLLQSATYNKVFTQHGILMIFSSLSRRFRRSWVTFCYR